MPLLFLLSVWALLVSFRRQADRQLTLLRIPLLVGIGATLVDFVLGYIAPRYLADFLPFLVLGGAVGMIDLWPRLEHHGKSVRRVALAVLTVLCLFSIAANVGIAVSPTTEWTPTQATNYVRAVKALSNITGHPLAKEVVQGSALPKWAPANQLFIVGNCAGLYLSSGIHYDTVPLLQAERHTWVPVEEQASFANALRITFNTAQLGTPIPLLSIGFSNIFIESAGHGKVRFDLEDPLFPIKGPPFKPIVGQTYLFNVETDPILHTVLINYEFLVALSGLLPGTDSSDVVVVHAQPPVAGQTPPVIVEPIPTRSSTDMSLCRSLLEGH
jgi:hypothetical protein